MSNFIGTLNEVVDFIKSQPKEGLYLADITPQKEITCTCCEKTYHDLEAKCCNTCGKSLYPYEADSPFCPACGKKRDVALTGSGMKEAIAEIEKVFFGQAGAPLPLSIDIELMDKRANALKPTKEEIEILKENVSKNTQEIKDRKVAVESDNKPTETLDNNQLMEKIKSLDGISGVDWLKIKTAIDESFKRKTKEFERQLKLSCDSDVEPAIRSLFG